jgi:hypothetical protein
MTRLVHAVSGNGAAGDYYNGAGKRPRHKGYFHGCLQITFIAASRQ